MTKLADHMYRDPPDGTKLREVAKLPKLAEAFKRVGLTNKDVPLVACPANRKKRVIDAVADMRCSLCEQLVWMSPSARSKSFTCITCLECLEKAMGWEAFESMTNWGDGRMKVFGANHPDLERVDVPVGRLCLRCEKPILETDRGMLMLCLWELDEPGTWEPHHYSCMMESMLGKGWEKHGLGLKGLT